MRRDSELERRIQERVSVSEDDIVRLDMVLEDGDPYLNLSLPVNSPIVMSFFPCP